MKSIPMTLYLPDTPEGLDQLAQQTAAVHADLILGQIKGQPCPSHQKRRLLESVIGAIPRENSGLRPGQLPAGPERMHKKACRSSADRLYPAAPYANYS